MAKSSSLILNNDTVQKKLSRITHQIIEENYKEKEIVLIGISENGFLLAETICGILKKLRPEIDIQLIELFINKKNPLKDSIQIKPEITFNDKKIILIDDVLNSGKTLMHAASYIISKNIAKMNTIVLVDRRHRSFPIKADWVGLTLSTTIQEHISVLIKNNEISVYLK